MFGRDRADGRGGAMTFASEGGETSDPFWFVEFEGFAGEGRAWSGGGGGGGCVEIGVGRGGRMIEGSDLSNGGWSTS